VLETGFIQQAGGGWMYNCPMGFPDGLADFGRLLTLWSATARADIQQPQRDGDGDGEGTESWAAVNLPRVLSLANFTLNMRRNASAHTSGDTKGLIWGPAEHDTCTVLYFRQDCALEDAIGSHACSLEANMRLTNGILLGSPLLTVVTINYAQH
jgi:hypothetical protein